MLASEQSTDRLLSFRTWADLIVVLGFLIASGTYLSIDQNYNGFFISLAAVLVCLGCLVGTAYKSMIWSLRGRPKRAAASLVKLAVILIPWLFGITVVDYVHLALYYPAYRHQIEAQGAGNTAPIRFFWGDKALWLTDGLQADTLVYDPTDALAKAVGEVRDEDPHIGIATRHLVGHFYLEREFSR